MGSKLIGVLMVSAIAITMAHAQQSGLAAQNFDRGKYEYEAHCAMCHGLNGMGDGFFAQQLKSGTVVPNLTELSKRNNGVFPFMRIYQIIDGRQSVMAHGPREMPIWGPRYKSEVGENFYDDYRADAEAFARARILALTEYVYRLQIK
ncbi:c-type cytochrome [Bradyrhizobium sp.]|uniref:c-type cytochrome n=1 Tax=Bradyrhizobium sp. TaxID=376 RepID=UPI003C723679